VLLSFRMRYRSAAAALAAGVLSFLPPAEPAHALLVGPELPVSDGTFIPLGDVTAQFLDIIDNPFNPEYTPEAQGRFQQVYDASVFGDAPLLIQEIRFFEDLPSVGTVNPSVFKFEIGTTALGVNQLACCAGGATPFADTELLLDSNRPANMQSYADNILLAGVFSGGVLTITAESPFVYDPSLGENLLLEISFDPRDAEGNLVPGLGLGPLSEKYFVRDGPNSLLDPSVFSAADNQDGFDNTGRGLRTEFITTVVPEPATALMLAVGLALLGLRTRR
jgi:hypothetical protein